MENIKTAIVGLISFLCIGAVLKYLIPDGNIKKVSEVLISALIVASFIGSISGSEIKNIKLPEFKNVNTNGMAYDTSVYSQALEDRITETLKKKGLFPKSVNVSTHVENNNLVIEEVSVTVAKGNVKTLYLSTLTNELGFDEEMIVIAEN